MTALDAKLTKLRAAGSVIYPDRRDRLKAFRLTSPRNVRVVIIGQDPYPDGKATGLAFAIKYGPPRHSLKTILKRIEDTYGAPSTGADLAHWATQNVLLLNTVLTVTHGDARSHRGWGWEQFTSAAIAEVKENTDAVFIAWGEDAIRLLDTAGVRSGRLLASHPRASRSRRELFSQCNHFVRANSMLKRQGKKPIRW